MRGLSDVVKHTGCFTLPTLREKSVREIDLPEVVLPGAFYPFLAFHSEYIRPYLLWGAKGLELALLNLYPDAKPLRDGSVLAAVPGFLRNEDPELSRITLANIRSSCATIAIAMYKKGRMFTKMPERFSSFFGRDDEHRRRDDCRNLCCFFQRKPAVGRITIVQFGFGIQVR